MQFSLKWLLIAIAFCAVSIAGVLNAHDLWVVGLRSVAVLTVVAAIVAAVWSVGRKRAFWSGYAITAHLSFVTFFVFELDSRLLTSENLTALHKRLFAPTTETFPLPQGFTWSRNPRIPEVNGDVLRASFSQRHGDIIVEFIRPKKKNLISVVHAVSSVVLGVVGGLIAVAFYRRGEALDS